MSQNNSTTFHIGGVEGQIQSLSDHISTIMSTMAKRQIEPLSLSSNAQTTVTISDLQTNGTYFLMLTGANPGGWNYIGMYCHGQQYQALVQLACTGVTITQSSGVLTIKNTSSYTLNGTITIIH